MFKISQIRGNWPVVMVRYVPKGTTDFNPKFSKLLGYFSYIENRIESLDGKSYDPGTLYNSAEIGIDDEGCEFLILTYTI